MNDNNEGESHGDESAGNQKTKLPPPRPMSPSGIHAGFRIEPRPLGRRPSNFGEKKRSQARPSDGANETPEGESKDDPEPKPKDPEIVWKRHERNLSWPGYVVFSMIMIVLIYEIFRLISSTLRS